MTLTILADDFTGACDTGALFTGRGAVSVTVWPDAPGSDTCRVIDTETRTLSAAAARDRVRSATERAPARRYFKKIDSTLRGRVGAETEGVMDASGAESALVCPAFPAQARVVIDRILLVDGRPVTETTLASDPQFPTTRDGRASVVELLRPQIDRPIAWIPLSEVRSGRDALAARLGRLAGTVVVADAETDGDLDALVAASLALERPSLLAGSAGLGRALADHLGVRAGPAPVPRGRWLVVVGSLHPASRRQAERARAEGVRVIESVDAREADPWRVAERLANEAVHVLESEPFDVVAVTGGETALALFRALDGERLELVGAPLPGLALGRLRSRRGIEPWLLTKAGGFGTPDLFVSLALEVAA